MFSSNLSLMAAGLWTAPLSKRIRHSRRWWYTQVVETNRHRRRGVVLLVSCVSDRKDSWKARGSLTLVFKIAFDTFLIDLIGFHLFKSTVTYILERRFVWKRKESSRVVWITSWLPSRGERWPDQMAVLREYLFLEEEKRREDPGWFRALCSSLYEQFFFSSLPSSSSSFFTTAVH